MPLVEVLTDMEWEGIRIDPEHFARLSAELAAGPTVAIGHAKRLLDGTLRIRGATPCVGLFTLDGFLAEIADLDIAAGEGLAGLLRRGNAGSNTAADHITVLDMALASLPKLVSL